MCETPKSPWQVPDNRRDIGATPLHLVRTIVAQQYRNAGRQEVQKEGTKCHCLWMDWMDPLPRKKRQKTPGRIKREREGPAVTFHLRRLTPPPEETLRSSKRLLIRPRVAGEGAGVWIKNSFQWGCSGDDLV